MQYFSVWDAETGEVHSWLGFVAADLGVFNAGLAISPNERLFAKIADDRITIDNLETRETVSTMFSSEGVRFNTIAFSMDSAMLATADTVGFVKIWDVANLAEDGSINQIITLADPGNLIHDMQFSPTGQWLATASSDGQIKLRNIEKQTGVTLPFKGNDLEEDEELNTSIAVSPLGNRMALASQNGSAAVYDLALGERLFQLGDVQLGPVEQIEYSPDGSTITTCRYDGPFQIWDAESGAELYRLEDYTVGSCSFEYNPDGHSIFLGFFKNGSGWHQELALPSFEPGSLIEADPLRSYAWQAPHEGATISLVFDEESYSLTVISEKGELFIWDTRTPIGTVEGATPLDPTESDALLVREERGYLEVLMDPTKNNLAVTGLDGSVRIIDPETNQFTGSIDAHLGQITAVAFSPDGSQLATSGLDRTVRVWDMATGEAILSLSDQAVIITDLAFSPDGTRLYAAGEDGSVRPYILDVDELIALAQSKATRTLTDEECRKYLYLESCTDP